MPDRMRKLLHAFAALADLGEEIADTSDFVEMVQSSLHVVLGALAIRRGAVAEHHPDAGHLKVVATRGIGDAPIAPVAIDAAAVETLGAGGAICFHVNSSDVPSSMAHRLGEQLETLCTGMRVELLMPLVVHGELVGVILLGGKASDEPFTAEDCETVRALARHIGVGIYNHRLLREIASRATENERLYGELRGLYSDTVRAFAAAIDCKDKYTQGHSERVGKYSEIIAREMGWSDQEVEGIAVAGYLHDIGKLVVDRDIINAPYKIDAKQSSELNRHPAAGYDILAPINHPYADIPLMARYHHERIDGRGYPDGLTGDQIPLGAKIITLADSFDAMTTDRPYKTRRRFDAVVDDLRRNTGKQFEAIVVVAFCRALLKEVNGETRVRHFTRLLGKDYLDGEQAAPLLIQLIHELETGAPHAAAGGA